MKRASILTTILFLGVISGAHAEDSKNPSLLKKDQIEIDASFKLRPTSHSSFNLNGTVGYFLMDRLSLNGLINLSLFPGFNLGEIGTGASYYPVSFGDWSPYGTQNVSLEFGGLTSFRGQSQLGVLYAILPNVGFKAFGDYSYRWSDFTAGSFVIGGAFTIFLK